MNRKILITGLVLAVVLLATPYIVIVYAEPFTTVAGDIEFIDEFWLGPPIMAGNNRIRMRGIVEEWTGDIVGISSTEARWIIHNAPLSNPDAWIIAHAILTFSDVTVLGQTGDMTIKMEVVGTECHWTIIGGTGGLANVHGRGTASTSTSPFTYTGMIHFDP